MIQGCYKDVTRVLHGCYKDVTRVLQGCYMDVGRGVGNASTISRYDK
jgi:hypothetical protein